ncbi:hypothetical protein SANTM175S_00593 [Streptomyces antimycoticus]
MSSGPRRATFWGARPARHTTLLTVVSSLVAAGSGRYGDQPPVYGWWTEQGSVEGAFLCTPPYPPLLSPCLSDEAARALARALAGYRRAADHRSQRRA